MLYVDYMSVYLIDVTYVVHLLLKPHPVLLRGVRGARVVDDGDQVSQVGRVAHRGLHALVRQLAADEEVACAEVPKHVVDVRRAEDRAGCLRDEDLVALRGHLSYGDFNGFAPAVSVQICSKQ